MSMDIHVHPKDKVEGGEVSGTGSFWFMVEDPDANTATMYFRSTNDARAFLAKVLNELHKVEAGDIPFSTHKDRIEYEVVS